MSFWLLFVFIPQLILSFKHTHWQNRWRHLRLARDGFELSSQLGLGLPQFFYAKLHISRVKMLHIGISKFRIPMLAIF